MTGLAGIHPVLLLTGGAAPEPFRHYPDGDVYDFATHSQFYCHVHRPGEAGHAHLFLRPRGMPPGLEPAHAAMDDAPCHLIAIGFDGQGRPTEMFTTNRWVTDEAWYPAAAVKAMLPRFEILAGGPGGTVGRLLTALVARHRGLIEELIDARDRALAEWRDAHPGMDALEARRLEILSRAEI